MKVHIWAPSFTEFGGGITQFSKELARVVPGNVRLFGKFDKPGNWEGIKVLGAGSWPGFLQTLVFAAQLLISAFIHRPDLIISTHVNFGPVAYVIHKWLKVPYLLIAHGIEVLPGISESRKKALLHAKRLLCVSRWSKGLVADLGVDPDQTGLILNTFDGGKFTVKARGNGALRHRLGISNNAKVILTVARLSATEGYKGYDRLLECLPEVKRILNDVLYVIVGKGDDRKRLEVISEKLGVGESVRLAGFVPDEELPEYYAVADVFAMPSTGEGYGIVFLEAMACGTPVLAGNLDGSTDALDDGRLGVLVNPKDKDSITEGLLKQLKQEGPEWWYEPEKLREAVIEHAGKEIFRSRIREEITKTLGT